MKKVFILFIVFSVFRVFEYLVLRTDQGPVGEAFIHKIMGISVFAFMLYRLGWKWRDTGFPRKGALRLSVFGLLLGIAVFTPAYLTEYLLLASRNVSPRISFFLSSYAIEGSRGMNAGFTFLLICILGNIINVVMEEGVFRGLFIRLGEGKNRWIHAMLFSALLFGIWHVAQPLRLFIDGEMPLSEALLAALTYTLVTTLMGIKYALLARLSGSVWLPMGEHFINNTLVNVLHVVSLNAVDELMSLRVGIAQILSIVVTIALFVRYVRKSRESKQR